MGLTISSPNFSIDMGCGGFRNLRNKVAELIGKQIGEHYSYLDKEMFLSGLERKKFLDEYNKKLSEIADKYKISHWILDFLYAPDCNAKISFGKCKQIYKVIENYDDNILYGYCGRKDCAMFKDFKKIVKDCIDNKCNMEWF